MAAKNGTATRIAKGTIGVGIATMKCHKAPLF